MDCLVLSCSTVRECDHALSEIAVGPNRGLFLADVCRTVAEPLLLMQTIIHNKKENTIVIRWQSPDSCAILNEPPIVK